MTLTDEQIRAITEKVGTAFRTFGGGRGSKWNPITEAMKDQPLAFAGMVPVEDVVRFVVEQIEVSVSA